MKPEHGQVKDRYARKPSWLKRRIPAGTTYRKVPDLVRKGGLHTVCEEALCPNKGECFSRGTATFLILGDRCTRDCRFCSVAHGPSGPPDPEEPVKVARAVQEMGLQYVVITSVTRDDLADGGAGLFARTIEETRKRNPEILVEVLIPDFQGDVQALDKVLEARPDVLNHNLETVPRLYPSVRPEAVYQRSLELLEHVRFYDPAIPTKSGLMLGLGETTEEIDRTLKDLFAVGCSLLTLGQYLQPTGRHLPVHRFVHPGEFEEWRKAALDLGFAEVASGPFVRSSYRAEAFYRTVRPMPVQAL
jgi:lipoic acid synthetase